MDSKAHEHLLHDLYNGPNPVSEKEFTELARKLFLGENSTRSRVEAFVLAKPQARDVEADQGLNTTDASSDISPCQVASTNALPSQFIKVEKADQLRSYAALPQAFRAYFIRQQNSYSALSINQQLYQDLLDVSQIPRQFNDYILYLGGKENEMEIAPTPLRYRYHSRPSTGNPEKTVFDVMYCIRFIDRNNKTDTAPPSSRWSLRQSAVCCHVDNWNQNKSWIFVNISQSTQDRLHDHFMSSNNPAMINPLHFHLLIYRIAIGKWRPYIVTLYSELEQHDAQLSGASPNNKGPLDMADAGERQQLLKLESRLLAAQLAIDATLADISHLRTSAVAVMEDNEELSPSERFLIERSFDENVRELQVSLLRLKHLQSRLDGITKVVTSFLDLSNGFALQDLARESGYENEQMLKLSDRMRELAEKNAQDAVVVKVLTILTLVYLPLTVVSNIFSTAFVGTSEANDRLVWTDDWWILFAIAIPLTAATLYVWWVWMRIKAYQKYPWWWIKKGI